MTGKRLARIQKLRQHAVHPRVSEEDQVTYMSHSVFFDQLIVETEAVCGHIIPFP